MIRNKVFIIACLGSLLGCQSTSIETKPAPTVHVSSDEVYISPDEVYVPRKSSGVAIENRIEMQPIVRLEPKYPMAAARQGVEGFCRVSFDIELKGAGHPHNIKVLECSPSGMFEANCITAVSKWVFAYRNIQESPNGLITTCEFKI